MTEPVPHPPTPERPLILRHFLQALAGAVLLELALATGEYVSLRHLPAGTAYVISPRGMGRAKEFLQMGLVVAGFSAFYTLPALMVRRALGCIFRALMFLIFTVMVAGFRMSEAIAVVETPQAFVFVYRAPLSAERVEFSEAYSVMGWPGGILRVEVNTRTRLSDISCAYVYDNDPETNRIVDALAARLREHSVDAKP